MVNLVLSNLLIIQLLLLLSEISLCFWHTCSASTYNKQSPLYVSELKWPTSSEILETVHSSRAWARILSWMMAERGLIPCVYIFSLLQGKSQSKLSFPQSFTSYYFSHICFHKLITRITPHNFQIILPKLYVKLIFKTTYLSKISQQPMLQETFFPSTGSMLSKAYFCFNITPSYVINDMWW